MNIILSVLLFNIIYSQCNDGYIDINENCYFESQDGSFKLSLKTNNTFLYQSGTNKGRGLCKVKFTSQRLKRYFFIRRTHVIIC